MKIHFKIPRGLKAHFENELQSSQEQFAKGNLRASWRHLERAHILGQAWPASHTKSHWRMLLFAFRIKSIQEITGHIPRLLVGGVKSFAGEIPTGNPGGANVPPLRPMEIPGDLLAILDRYKT